MVVDAENMQSDSCGCVGLRLEMVDWWRMWLLPCLWRSMFHRWSKYHRPPIPLILLRSGIPNESRDRLSRVESFPHKAVMEFVDMHNFLTYK